MPSLRADDGRMELNLFSVFLSQGAARKCLIAESAPAIRTNWASSWSILLLAKSMTGRQRQKSGAKTRPLRRWGGRAAKPAVKACLLRGGLRLRNWLPGSGGNGRSWLEI
jgi:hypothetical protein